MARMGSKTPESSPQGMFVPVTAEVRKLAGEIAKVFDELSSGRVGFAEQRHGSDHQFIVFVSEILLVVKTVENFRCVALKHLAELGKVKNKNFPSSQDDRIRKQSEYEKICQLRLANRPLWKLYNTVKLGRVFNVKTEILQENETTMCSEDPLETPAILLGENDPESELLIFLEHYLPQDLAEVAQNLADTNREYCPLSSKSHSLLFEFNRCYQAFPVIRTALLLPNRNTSKYLDDAHVRLLELTQLILDSSLKTLPQRVAIREEKNELVFVIDDIIVNLTMQQQETLVTLAILLKDSKFSVEEFTEIICLRGKGEQHVINRCRSLREERLPSLEYKFNKGICTLHGFRFEELPSEERLRKEF